MARITRHGDDVLLLIDHSVGKNGSNRHDDVQLIQLLLNIANQRNGIGNEFYHSMRSPLAIDGRCGAETQAAIRQYQKSYNRQPGFSAGYKMMNEDGVITATSEMLLWGSGGYRFTTMHALNTDFQLFLKYQWIELQFFISRFSYTDIVATLKSFLGL